jgi:hypothetical protein
MRAALTTGVVAVALSACQSEPAGEPAARGATPERGTYQPIVVKEPQQSAAFLAAADLDGDGRKELILSTLVELTPPGPPGAYSRGALRLFSHGGDIAAPWQERVLISTLDPQGVPFINTPQVMDVDGDGQLDIIVQTGFLSTLGGVHGWLAGPGFDGPLQYFAMESSPLGNDWFFWHESAQLDLDGDGRLDIVTTSARTQSLSNPLGSPDGNEQLKVEWYRNLGDGAFSYHRIADGVGGVFLKAHDVDGDGDADLILSQFFGPPAAPSVLWLENVEAPAAANAYAGVWQTHVIDTTIGLGYHMELVDLDGDGRLDLVVGSHNNDGDPRWQDANGRVTTPAGIYRFEIPANPRAVAQWTRHTVAEDFPVTLSYMNPASQGSPGIFAVGDIDGDGRLDLAVPGDGTNDLFALRQRADGSFIREIVDTGKMYGMAVIADLDGDGRNEIIAAQHNSADGGATLPPGKLAVYRFVVGPG